MALSIEKVQALKALCDAYGVAVRAGTLTPCLEDENEFRKIFGLPPAPESVVAQWESTRGVRLPITLQQGLDEAETIEEGTTT